MRKGADWTVLNTNDNHNINISIVTDDAAMQGSLGAGPITGTASP